MPATTHYRLRYGHRVWSRWFDCEADVWPVAERLGFTSTDRAGRTYAEPLMWIELGQRERSKARTVPMDREPDGRPLNARHRNPLLEFARQAA